MENSPFKTFNNTHMHLTDDEPTFRIMANYGKSMISNVNMQKE